MGIMVYLRRRVADGIKVLQDETLAIISFLVDYSCLETT